jgi:hypothetical protein
MKDNFITMDLYNNVNYDEELYRNDYKEHCADNQMEYNEESFSIWLNDELVMEYNDLLENLEYSEYNIPCVILGSIGTWRGRIEIEATYAEDLISAIKKCVGSAYYIKICLNKGKIEVYAYHHDGTNTFDIILLNNRKRSENSDISKSYYHKLIKGYIF